MNVNSRYSGSVPPDLISKHFTNKNWLLGKSASHDLCPSCISIQANERRARVAERENQKERAAVRLSRELSAALVNEPPPEPQLPAVLDLSEEARRGRVKMLTKLDALRFEQTFIQGSILALIDRSAAVEDEIEALKPLAAAIAGVSEAEVDASLKRYEEQENDPMFTKLMGGSGELRRTAILGRVVRLGFSRGNPYSQTRITISADLAKELGFKVGQGDRVFLHEGTGEDAGRLMIERTKDRNGSVFADVRASGSLTIATTKLHPADPGVQSISATNCGFSVVEGSLLIKLPPQFVEVSTATRTFQAARVASHS